MEQSDPSKHEPECPLVHQLINKLSVIVGNCDLLVEKTPQDSPLLPRMLLVQSIAKSMAADLAQFECDLLKQRMQTREEPPALDR
jgi:hypothetical protein